MLVRIDCKLIMIVRPYLPIYGGDCLIGFG